MSIKYISLVVLAIQNSALILVMRYSRTLSGPKYIPTTAVLLSEIIKAVLSMTVLLYTRWKARSTSEASSTSTPEQQPSSNLVRDCFSEILQVNALIPVMIPAILYTIQNNLQYLAASNLDAATFQVLYQGKILTTAFFAILILRQKLNAGKWAGIFVLTIGLVSISYPSATTAKIAAREILVDTRMIGLLAVLSACVLSGFTGVLLEFILKKANRNSAPGGESQLWTRNVQLSMASIIMASLAAVAVDGRQILSNGFFYGYSPIVWLTLMLQAVGGLVVAIVITYADNILKGFATSLSLIASTAVSAMAGDTVLTQRFVVGVVLVLAATNVYGFSSMTKTKAVSDETQSLIERDPESQLDQVDVEVKDMEDSPREFSDEKASSVMEETEYMTRVAVAQSTTPKPPTELLSP